MRGRSGWDVQARGGASKLRDSPAQLARDAGSRMKRRRSRASIVGAAFVAAALRLALSPAAEAQGDDTPPLPPVLERGLLGVSCADERAAGEPICQQWRRRYEAWKRLRKATTEVARLEAETARLAAEADRLGRQRGLFGFDVDYLCTPGSVETLPVCHEYLKLKARLDAARAELLAATQPPDDQLPAAPSPETGLSEKVNCSEVDASKTLRCQRWFQELTAQRRQSELRRKIARLAAEADRLGSQRGLFGFNVDYLCTPGSVETLPVCHEYLKLKARLDAARAAYAALTGSDQAILEGAAIYLVLVNASNRYFADETELKAQIKALYLKKSPYWPDGELSTPIGRPLESPAQQAFLKEVLGMSATELDEYWRRLEASQGVLPPPEVLSARGLLQRVARNKGAFAVVGERRVRRLPAKVRILFWFAASQ